MVKPLHFNTQKAKMLRLHCTPNMGRGINTRYMKGKVEAAALGERMTAINIDKSGSHPTASPVPFPFRH